MVRRTQARTRAGFTLLELIISITVLAILARMVIGATSASSGMTSMGNIEARALRMSEKAMQQIVRDLRMSGEQVVDGRSFPYVFDGGVATGAFAEFSYTPAPMTAMANEADFGVMRSIVLALPSDFDGNGRPEIDANGNGVPELDGNGDGVPTDTDPTDTAGIWDANAATIDADTRLVWSHATVAYVVTTGPTGDNELVRLVSNGADGREVIATGVERIQFDTPATSGFTIPGGTVRVRIFFRLRDSEGHVYRSSNEAIIRLRNS